MIPFIFTFGVKNFPGSIDGFEQAKFYCPKCHNTSVQARKEREFFTVCFVPLIPINFGKQLHCTICNWSQGITVEALENMQRQQQGQQPHGQAQPVYGK